MLFFDARPKDGKVKTKGVWIYDLRTNKHFTLKTKTLRREDLQEFVDCYNPDNRHQRSESERFKYFDYETLIARDKASLDIFWLKDDSLEIWKTCRRRTCWRRKSSNILKQRSRRFETSQRPCRGQAAPQAIRLRWRNGFDSNVSINRLISHLVFFLGAEHKNNERK